MEKRNSPSFLLSDLPDSLLHHIVEQLPIKSAVRTSLISCRFRDMWKSVRRLDFDHQSLGIRRTCGKIHQQEQLALRLAAVVDQVLRAHPETIATCRISLYYSNCDYDVPRWVAWLKERGIQELNLRCYGPCILLPFQDEINKPTSKFPSGLFTCRSLQVLELKWFGLEDAGSFMGANNLVSLTLQGVTLRDKTLLGVLEHCNCLETLVLLRCSRLEDVKIHAARLNSLELIQGESGILHSIDVDIPKATKLVLDVVDCHGPVDIVAPNLQFLFAHRRTGPEGWNRKFMSGCKRNLDAIAKFFGVYGMRSMESYPESRHPFEQLQRLAIEVDLNDPRDASVVAFILRNCHDLQELDIKNAPNSGDSEKVGDSSSKHQCLPYPATEFWKRQDSFDCVAFVMRTVKIRGITGQCLELEFAKYMIAAAARLQNMVIHLGRNCSEEGVTSSRELLSLPRISLHAQIILS